MVAAALVTVMIPYISPTSSLYLSALYLPLSQVVAAVLVAVMLACAAACWVRELTWQVRVKG